VEVGNTTIINEVDEYGLVHNAWVQRYCGNSYPIQFIEIGWTAEKGLNVPDMLVENGFAIMKQFVGNNPDSRLMQYAYAEKANLGYFFSYGTSSGQLGIFVGAKASEKKLVDSEFASLAKLFPEHDITLAHTVDVQFSSYSKRNDRGSTFTRNIDIVSWDDIQTNYGESSRDGLQSLINDFKPTKGGQLILWHGEPGTGKAQPLDAKVLTPSGWKNMGDLKIGDEVLTPLGKVTSIINTYPQGEKDIYCVEFHDGTSAECCEEHLWKVQSHSNRQEENRHKKGLKRRNNYEYNKDHWELKSLKEITSKPLRYNDKNRFYNTIPMVSLGLDLTLEKKDLPLDPYLLGALLGDGCFRGSTPLFTNIDSFIVNKVSSKLPKDHFLKPMNDVKPYNYVIRGNPNLIKNTLIELELWQLNSQNKFIPEIYKWTTSENRLSLLQGLMDTDGTVGNGVIFNTSSPKLRDGVKFLVQSLGGTATLSERISPLANGLGVLAYNVQIRLPNCAFTLPRKIERLNSIKRQKPLRSIKNVTYIGKKQAKCVQLLDKEGLYVTDNFIVTHNTYSLRALTEKWSSWCDFYYILDPEVFLMEANYMTSLISDDAEDYKLLSFLPEDDQKKARKWKLFVLEDAGELISEEAREKTGQGLSRLLNIADGLIGQGLRILLLITTNEPLKDYHPAIARPGRCASSIEFKALTKEECIIWADKNDLDKDLLKEETYTVADLYALKAGAAQKLKIESVKPRKIGF
jgi:hypothetical protein